MSGLGHSRHSRDPGVSGSPTSADTWPLTRSMVSWIGGLDCELKRILVILKHSVHERNSWRIRSGGVVG